MLPISFFWLKLPVLFIFIQVYFSAVPYIFANGTLIRSDIEYYSGQEDSLILNFKNPPAEYTILPFWSWNNTLEENKLKWQVDQMLDKGIYGAFMHARAGLDESATPYFSDGWWKAVESTVKYASEKGFYSCLYDEDKWPSGSAGGRTIAVNPAEFIKKALHYVSFEVYGPQVISLSLFKNAYAIFAGKISEKGFYSFASQVDLSSLAGKTWNVPEGKWAVTVFNIIIDPHEQIDYMDAAAVASFLHITHDEYYKRLGKYFGSTIPGVFFDEIYASFSDRQNNIFWTDDFPEQFKKIKLYELKSRLPLIILNDPVNSAPVRYDYFDVVKDLYTKAWYKQYTKWGDDHRIWVTGHTTELMSQFTRQSDYFYTIGQLQIPGTDNEDYRYSYPRRIDWYNPKQISSIGHIYGKKRVMAETMGGGGYVIPLDEYRYGAAMLGVYGINMFVPHLFHYSMDRPENQADWPPSWFYQNPYWKYFKPLSVYMQRISYMISSGHHVCDVAVLYPLTDLWLTGYSQSPDDSYKSHYYNELQRKLLINNIDYDVIDPSSLAEAEIDTSGLKLADEHYKILVLPALSAVRNDVLQKIKLFTDKGGILVCVGGLPLASQKSAPIDPVNRKYFMETFGFDPEVMGSRNYYTINKRGTNNYTIKENMAGGKCIFTWFVNELPDIINTIIDPDVLVLDGDKESLRFNHRIIANRNSYFFVNEYKEAKSLLVSVRSTGKPYIWHPETGNIKEFSNYRLKNGRLECVLTFEPGEAYFIVTEPCTNKANEVLVRSTNLRDFKLFMNNGKATLEGWAPSYETHNVTWLEDNCSYSKSWKDNYVLPEIVFGNNWDFQLSHHGLDYKWLPSVKCDTVELPVMKFRPERTEEKYLFKNYSSAKFDDKDWIMIKVEDPCNLKKGCSRYLSDWDAWWINYYNYSMHFPEISGGTKYFRYSFTVNGNVKNASIYITADEDYELFVNGNLIGKDKNWKDAEHYNIRDNIIHGENKIIVKTGNSRGLLLQGSVEIRNGRSISIQTDSTWQASDDSVSWNAAFRYAVPPIGRWGNIARTGHQVNFPVAIWYRQILPPGAFAIMKPEIKGIYQIYVNGIPVIMAGKEFVNIAGMVGKGMNILSVRVQVSSEDEGLYKPIKVLCGQSSMPLIPWSEMGLNWYSGRAIYSQNIYIPDEYFKSSVRMIIDPGTVDYFAEIWVNDQLATFRPWAPFNADITKLLKPGINKITIIVANLLANEATWNIYDANLDVRDARWWHYGAIMREQEKLVSGLLGPVKIIPLTLKSITLDK